MKASQLICWTQGRPESVLRPRQTSVFTSEVHVTLNFAVEVAVIIS